MIAYYIAGVLVLLAYLVSGRSMIGFTPSLHFERGLFGQILRDQGKVTQEALDAALAIQAKERKYIGQILCEMGHISAADIEAALAIQESYGLR